MEKRPERPQNGRTVYLAEAEDGFLTRVPEEKLESWQEAQGRPAAPLNKAEQRLKDKILRRIYGGRE